MEETIASKHNVEFTNDVVNFFLKDHFTEKKELLYEHLSLIK